MASTQLRLVNDRPPAPLAAPCDPVRAVFEHWVALMGRHPSRCKLDKQRREVIASALAIGYEVDVLLQAVEGMAADPLEHCAEARMRDAMREVEWLLARASRIERWADRGAELRAQALREHAERKQQAQAPAATAEAEQKAHDEAASLAARARLAELARRRRQGGA